MARKILISPGYGAGWTTWHSGPKEEIIFMLEYKPFVEAIEKNLPIDKELEKKFLEDFEEKFPKREPPYMGGVEKLEVHVIGSNQRVHVTDYDGNETFITSITSIWI